MELCLHDKTHQEYPCRGRIVMGCMDQELYFKGQEFLADRRRPQIQLEFQQTSQLRAEALPVISNRTLTIREIWQEIRINGEKVPWQSLIWFPLHIPKHSMIAWMALLDRLPTRYRLQRMGILTAGNCVLCSDALESCSHLFFECFIATQLWEKILHHNGITKSISSWDDMVDRASNTWKVSAFLSNKIRIFHSRTFGNGTG
ncbi:uncharacterized protein LOC120124149 [Hibiscus syriacus]|uniref:uncharacterized protein LOC120124149 n=1 Tax=Hibiscus syriacus TaxID=106335 RepID=UPI0019208E7B|nr:uncharacterized protein LOC120124149 [Hibiscus syriacus]